MVANGEFLYWTSTQSSVGIPPQLSLKVRPHGRTVSVGQTLLPYKAKEDDVINVETREVDMVTNSGTS